MARFVAALAGAGIVLLALALCPFVGRAQAMGMAVLATFSPTMLYASRVAEAPVLIAFFAMLLLVSLLYHGRNPSGWWAAGIGLGLGGMFASGPASISVLLCMVVGFVAAWLVDSKGEGAARTAVDGLRSGMHDLLILGLTFLGTLLIFFTHGFSSLSALQGIPETISSWGRMVVTSESSIPTQYFLLVILLYEILALVCALVGFAVEGKEGPGRLSSLFLGWFVASLVLFSFSSGRSASQAVLVVLPLVLWGGYGAGALLEAVDWREISGRKAAMLVLTIFGWLLAVLALIAALGRIGSSSDSTRASRSAHDRCHCGRAVDISRLHPVTPRGQGHRNAFTAGMAHAAPGAGWRCHPALGVLHHSLDRHAELLPGGWKLGTAGGANFDTGSGRIREQDDESFA
ncbi:MAG: hypothetical protein R2855_02025 [Thermomicrobiales bacterium]